MKWSKRLHWAETNLRNYMYAILKRCVLRRDLNNDIELIALISSGSLFQSVGAA